VDEQKLRTGDPQGYYPSGAVLVTFDISTHFMSKKFLTSLLLK